MYKSFCNLIFSLCAWLLLEWIGVDLAVVIALICFFLSFIPEIGSLVSLALPVPLLLLDSRHPLALRARNVLTSVIGMLFIKFVVSNGLESVVMGKSATLAGKVSEEGNTEETHPVLILFVVILFGEIWGATGMLVSVPLISMVRLTINLERSIQKRTEELRCHHCHPGDSAERAAEEELLGLCH